MAHHKNSQKTENKQKTAKNEMFQTADIVDILDQINTFSSISDTGDGEKKLALINYGSEKSLTEAGFGEAQIVEIIKGNDQGVDVRRFAKHEYNWMQMRELRLGLLKELDVTFYENPLYTANQMHEIRFGLEMGFDVSDYAKLFYSATDMHRMCEKLFTESYSLNPKGFSRIIKDDLTGLFLKIKDDCLMALITIPKKPRAKITKEYILDFLEEHFIVYGIKQEAIDDMLSNNITEKEVCVAAGKAAGHGKNGWYELNFENLIDKKAFLKPDYNVDYSSVNTVENVSLGQTLVKYHPAETMVSGITIFGMPIEGVSGRELPILKGTGFKYNPEKKLYYATRKGYPSFNSITWSLNIWDVYQINGDVSYFQSIEYNGSIHIHGNVKSLATVKAVGDIIVDGFIEGASLFSDQNIVIKGGVNGGGKGVISAGGSLKSNFFENANIIAKGPIESNYFLNCEIKTDERVVAHGKKARIMGGKINAAISVEAVFIGNQMGFKPLFTVGDVAALEHRIYELTKALNEANEQLVQLEEGKKRLLTVLGGAEAAKSNKLYDKTLSAIFTLENQSDTINREIERLKSISSRAQKAYVKVHGELQEGVVFFINGNKKVIGKTITSSITLTKEKAKGR